MLKAAWAAAWSFPQPTCARVVESPHLLLVEWAVWHAGRFWWGVVGAVQYDFGPDDTLGVAA